MTGISEAASVGEFAAFVIVDARKPGHPRQRPGKPLGNVGRANLQVIGPGSAGPIASIGTWASTSWPICSRFLRQERRRPAIRQERQRHLPRQRHRLVGAGQILAQIVDADGDHRHGGVRRGRPPRCFLHGGTRHGPGRRPRSKSSGGMRLRCGTLGGWRGGIAHARIFLPLPAAARSKPGRPCRARRSCDLARSASAEGVPTPARRQTAQPARHRQYAGLPQIRIRRIRKSRPMRDVRVAADSSQSPQNSELRFGPSMQSAELPLASGLAHVTD